MCASNRAGPSAKCDAQRSRFHARSSVARLLWPAQNGGKRNVTACSSTTTRTQKTGPLALPIRCVPCLMPGCLRPFIGMRFPTASLRTLRCSPCPAALPRLAIRTRIWMRPRVRSKHCWNSRQRTRLQESEMRHGLRTSARWKAKRRGWRRREPNRLPRNPRGRNCRCSWSQILPQRRRAGGSGEVEEQARGGGGLLAVDDVLVDSMRGTSSTWTRIRVNLRHVPEDLRPPQETPTGTTTQPANGGLGAHQSALRSH